MTNVFHFSTLHIGYEKLVISKSRRSLDLIPSQLECVRQEGRLPQEDPFALRRPGLDLKYFGNPRSTRDPTGRTKTNKTFFNNLLHKRKIFWVFEN
jgi:hypothetical protein